MSSENIKEHALQDFWNYRLLTFYFIGYKLTF